MQPPRLIYHSYLLFLCSFFAFVSENAFAQACRKACTGRFQHSGRLKALQSRSDTIDILHTSLDLDFSNVTQQQMKAKCTHHLQSLQNGVNRLDFDLLGLTVDSVTYNNSILDFTHSNELLAIYLPFDLNQNDTLSLNIHYQGQPQQDASGWGGFYFSGSFAYNLGVGFAADPHSFGRAWFPCFDNFVERSTYSYQVLTTDGKTAYCNGALISEVPIGADSLLTTWELDLPIPSYLASIAVGNLTHMETFYQSTAGNEVPMWLTGQEQNMNNIEASFVHLPDCMQSFESHFGPYQWNRVGFVFVPFNSGAMEHATNIAYPIAAANGTLQFETLMAHELSHHWWGDAVTCRTAEDMWLNEGWAKYCEAVFLESKYGSESYNNFIRNNHADVIRNAHLSDGARLPVSGIGHENTYGDHVYNKGADVVHTLRGYMGDEAFFNACTDYQAAFHMNDASSQDLRDYFQEYTSVDLTSFFDNRIFQPGYAGFLIDESEVVADNDGWMVNLKFRQRLHYADALYENAPYQIKFWDISGDSESHSILLSGLETNVSILSNIMPVVFELDPDFRINDARLRDVVSLHQTGTTTLNQSDFRINISSMAASDSLWLFIDNYWVAPDDSPWQDGFRLSDDRFWRIQGMIPQESSVTGRVNFWGNSSGGSYFDPKFFEYLGNLQFPEDSLLMLYRPNPDIPWSIIEGFSINTLGSNTNMFGRIEFPMVQPGDYTWGIRDQGDGILEQKGVDSEMVFPNPTTTAIRTTITSSAPFQILDLNGKILISGVLTGEEINIEHLAAGAYIIKTFSQGQEISLPFVKN